MEALDLTSKDLILFFSKRKQSVCTTWKLILRSTHEFGPCQSDGTPSASIESHRTGGNSRMSQGPEEAFISEQKQNFKLRF